MTQSSARKPRHRVTRRLSLLGAGPLLRPGSQGSTGICQERDGAGLLSHQAEGTRAGVEQRWLWAPRLCPGCAFARAPFRAHPGHLQQEAFLDPLPWPRAPDPLSPPSLDTARASCKRTMGACGPTTFPPWTLDAEPWSASWLLLQCQDYPGSSPPHSLLPAHTPAQITSVAGLVCRAPASAGGITGRRQYRAQPASTWGEG